jgi:hypothetical protein
LELSILYIYIAPAIFRIAAVSAIDVENAQLQEEYVSDNQKVVFSLQVLEASNKTSNF